MRDSIWYVLDDNIVTLKQNIERFCAKNKRNRITCYHVNMSNIRGNILVPGGILRFGLDGVCG